MKDNVVIKGNKYGLTLIIKEDATMDVIKEELIAKLGTSKKFFSESDVAVSFDGKKLSTEEQEELIELISNNSKMKIVCILDNDSETESRFKAALDTMAQTAQGVSGIDENVGNFHKGTLRSGQLLESDTSIVVIGDVNPGANIVAKGNIVIIGSLKGTAYAGANGDSNCFVVALKMNAMQIRIADTIARCPDNHTATKALEPQIAFISDGNICIENLY